MATNSENNTITNIKKEEEVHGWYITDTFDMKLYLQNRLHGQLAYYNKRSGQEKDKFMKYQLILIVGSALTPALVSLASMKFDIEYVDSFLLALTMITSILVSISANFLKTFKYQENWASIRAVCEMINREKFLYEASVGDYSDKAKRDGLFVERIEGLLAREQNQWLAAATQQSSNSKTKDEDNDGVPDEVDDDVKSNDKKLDLPTH